MEVRGAIIGGTGVASAVLFQATSPVIVPTPFGIVRARILSERKVLFVARHGIDHCVPPHRVAYRALASAMHQLGVPAVFSTGAVGSLRKDLAPGTLIACSDLLDFSGRHVTRFERHVVHTDMTAPFDPSLRRALLSAARREGLDVQDGGVYVCSNGPRYETPAEIAFYRSAGGDVIGMTVGTEAVAMREAGVPYACLAGVTNLAAGLTESTLEHQEVSRAMISLSEKMLRILLAAIDEVCGDA
jgi:5'-methylthioadenosine phosphorylase